MGRTETEAMAVVSPLSAMFQLEETPGLRTLQSFRPKEVQESRRTSNPVISAIKHTLVALQFGRVGSTAKASHKEFVDDGKSCLSSH